MAGEIVLRASGLAKRFGKLTAVDGIDIEVRRGEIVGLLGPNGAGKSTTIGMVLGLIKPTAGRREVMGTRIGAGAAAVLARVGAIFETPAFYPYLSGRDNLLAVAMLHGAAAIARVDTALARLGLTARARSKVRTYSLGMRQRLGVAATILADPALVILDEPANGLDPAGQVEMRSLIRELAAEGRGVLLASHLLHEVQQVCDRVVVIHRGRLLMTGTIESILARASGYCVEVDEMDRAAEVLRALPFVHDVRPDGAILAVAADKGKGAELNRALAAAGIYAESIERRTTSLEEVFLEITGTGTDAGAPA